MKRQVGKETRLERQEREAIQEFGSLVCPSQQVSSVLAYRLVPGSGSRYSVLCTDGSKFECSRAQLLQLTREDVAAEAV